jgi:hypothetical protein
MNVSLVFMLVVCLCKVVQLHDDRLVVYDSDELVYTIVVKSIDVFSTSFYVDNI